MNKLDHEQDSSPEIKPSVTASSSTVEQLVSYRVCHSLTGLVWFLDLFICKFRNNSSLENKI